VHDPPTQLKVAAVIDPEEAKYLQYWVQLSFWSVDVHLRQAWTLAGADEARKLRNLAAVLSGPLVYSLQDVDEVLGPGQTWEDILEHRQMNVDWRGILFPVGTVPRVPYGQGEVHQYLLCTLALGKTTLGRDEGVGPRFPEGFSSVLVRSDGREGTEADYRSWYLIKDREQVLPIALCEVAFRPARVAVGTLLCEMCEQRDAAVYCFNDNAHFCIGCDTAHHSENEFFARHRRVPIGQSPRQFGFCQYHPTERYECVCLDCKRLLCPHCIIIGPHADRDQANHVLVSTIDVFREAMQGNSDSDKDLRARRMKLREALSQQHLNLKDVQGSLEDTQHELDAILMRVLDQVSRAQRRRTDFLQSVKRQVLSQMLFFQWLENFLAHARLAVPASDYLVMVRRHQDLLEATYSGAAAGSGTHAHTFPPWVDEDLVIEGFLSVSLAAQPVPNPAEAPALPPAAPAPLMQLKELASATPQFAQATLGPCMSDIADDPGVALCGAQASQVGLGRSMFPQGQSALQPQQMDVTDAVAAAAAVKGPSDVGVSYMEAAPRQPTATRVRESPLPAGIAGVSDTLYANNAPGTGSGTNASADMQRLLHQALTTLAGDRPTAVERPLGAPSRGGGGALATEVIVELRKDLNAGEGSPGAWGVAMALLQACPNLERTELMAKIVTASGAFGDASAQLAKRVVDEDVRQAQFPTLLAAANGVLTSLTSAMLRLTTGQHSPLEVATAGLLQDLESIPLGVDNSTVVARMAEMVSDFTAHLCGRMREGERVCPPWVATLCHFLYAAAEVKFGIATAQNAVVTLLVSRVISPSLLRLAQRGAVRDPAIQEGASRLSRLLQQAAHFTHQESESGSTNDPALQKRISDFREVVNVLLAQQYFPSLAVEASTEEADEAAAWIISTCRRWSSMQDSDDALAAYAARVASLGQ